MQILNMKSIFGNANSTNACDLVSSSSSKQQQSNLYNMKLSELARPLNLFVEVDYLGYLDIESKYLQASTLQWLIAQVKLLEVDKRILNACMEVNVKTNTIYAYKLTNGSGSYQSRLDESPSRLFLANSDQTESSARIELFSHALSNIFKLTYLDNDPNCFAYFYRKNESFSYTLHVFSSKKSNMFQVLNDFQKQASKLHDHLYFQKVFDFKLVDRIKITQEELKMSNFIEVLIDKATLSNVKTKKKGSVTSLQSRQQLLNDFRDRESIYLKFDSTKIYFRELDGEWTGHDYRNILCLNNSIIYENYFCIAYETISTVSNVSNRDINALILYSDNPELIDSVIREYALSISSKLNNNYETKEYTRSSISNEEVTSPTKSPSGASLNQNGQLVFGSKVNQHTCAQCPMQQFVDLCEYLNSLGNENEQISYILFEKLNYNLSDKDQQFVLDCLTEQNLTFESYQNAKERNQLLVGIIHKLCSKKQSKHLLFIFNRKDAIQHYLVEDEFAFSLNENRAKSKLNASFTYATQSRSVYTNLSYIDKMQEEFNKRQKHLWRRRRRHTLGSSEMSSVKKILEYSMMAQKQNMISRKFDMMLNKSTPKRSSSKATKLDASLDHSISTPPTNLAKQLSAAKSRDSMRRSIFNKIVGSAMLDELNASNSAIEPASDQLNKNLFKNLESTNDNINSNNNSNNKIKTTGGSNQNGVSLIFKRFKSKNDVVQFWKKIISEQILLNKMDKENVKLKTKMSAANAEEREKFEKVNFGYNEITPCLKEVDKTWQSWLIESKNDAAKAQELENIRNTVLKGVPQLRRGEIWLWLKDQYKLRNKRVTYDNIPELSSSHSNIFNWPSSLKSKLNTSYKELLKQTTIHQHSILLDLDRTFPTHPNFEKKFGAGQLALFNVLKAYSVLDNEVGYCQGLSFIVGVLLIHVKNSEEHAFELLKFLLIDLNLREQYKPDMLAFQKHMYQFTRLLHDLSYEIYSHLEENDVSTSLYAAPWFLTLYSSQFQMGFISRVFDFLFAEGPSVLFKISLSILNIHKPILMTCDSFESIMNHIKMTVPEMSLIECELIINKSFNVEVSSILHVYDIEFGVLNEDFQASATSLLTYNLIQNLNDPRSFKMKNAPFGSGPPSRRPSNQYTSLQTSQAQQIRINEQLELENFKLKTQINDLLSKISLMEINRQNQDDSFYKIYHENKQLKCKIQTLELERASLLSRLRDQDKTTANRPSTS